MSRKTKQKSKQYGVLPNGQVVRLDTMTSPGVQMQVMGIQGYKHAEVQWNELDLDHTREHRDELKERSRRATENARQAGIVK